MRKPTRKDVLMAMRNISPQKSPEGISAAEYVNLPFFAEGSEKRQCDARNDHDQGGKFLPGWLVPQ